MKLSIEERLGSYRHRLDDAINEYDEHARSRVVPPAFLETAEPARDRTGGRRRLAATLAVCLVASAAAAVVISQRDPSPRQVVRPDSPTTPLPSTTTVTSTTTVASTATVGSTAVTAPPLPLKGAVDLEHASLFGFAPGTVNPETVLAALTPELGPPTRDTGWYRTPSVKYDCLGGVTQRILRWGSVSYAFWRQSNPTLYTLWGWTLGDSRAAGWGDRHEPHPIVERPVVPATTATGIGIGTTVDALRSAFGSRFIGGSGQPAQISLPGANSILLWLTNGRVAGIAGLLPFC